MYEIIEKASYYYEIKNSKFYSFIYNVKSVDDVNNILNDLKGKYKKATHYTYAYKIDNIIKKDDDNEPSGTAGSPILNIIEKNNLDNVLIVVIRYFGGIKLGAGGLIRAYSLAAKNVINSENLRKIEKKEKIEIKTNYKELDRILSLINKDNIIDKKFDENIVLTVSITKKDKEKLIKNNITFKNL